MEKILIIDDDRLSLKVVKEILSKVGYKTLEAESGEAGLLLVRSEHPDLVITDFQMPGIDGLEVLYEIRKLNIGLPVILLTGFGDVVLTIKSIQLGAFDFLEKPIDPLQLKSIVQLALNSVKVSHGLNEVPNEDASSESMLESNILVGKTPPDERNLQKYWTYFAEQGKCVDTGGNWNRERTDCQTCTLFRNYK